MLHHADVCLSGGQRHSFHNWTLTVTFAHHLFNISSSFNRELLFLQWHVLTLSPTLTVPILCEYNFSHGLLYVESEPIYYFIFLFFEPFISGSSAIITSLGWSYCLFGGRRWSQWDGMCGKLFPLKGGGMTQLNKTHCVLKNGHPHTTHTPSQSVPIS